MVVSTRYVGKPTSNWLTRNTTVCHNACTIHCHSVVSSLSLFPFLYVPQSADSQWPTWPGNPPSQKWNYSNRTQRGGEWSPTQPWVSQTSLPPPPPPPLSLSAHLIVVQYLSLPPLLPLPYPLTPLSPPFPTHQA